MDFRKKILIDFLEKFFDNYFSGVNIKLENRINFENLIKSTKNPDFGDFTLPIFFIFQIYKKNPQEITKEIQETLITPEFLEKIDFVSGFINFYFNKSFIGQHLFEMNKNKNLFQSLNYTTNKKNKKKILIEFPSPNTNKSLHIGHSRNMLLGNSLSNVLEKAGIEVKRVNLNNDRGISICYAMLIYEKFYKDKTPEDFSLTPDGFVSKCYSEFKGKSQEDPSLEKQAQEMLIKWENNDKETIQLWNKIVAWVYQGYKKTYQHYNLKKFDYEFYESKIYDKGKEIILKGLKDKIFEKEEDGGIYVDLEDVKLGKKFLLRSDGTSIYITQDIYLASLKQEMFNADTNIFIVGIEQEYHFKVLFEILKRLGYGNTDKNLHLAYGYVFDENGKKFSSRLGNTIGADEILSTISEKAKLTLQEKDFSKHLSAKELESRARKIGFASLAFSFLKTNNTDAINFSINKALMFEGETASYILYTYARINSILKKNKEKNKFDFNKIKYKDEESSLINTLLNYPEILTEASEKFKVNLIANYTLDLAQKFNNFYHKYSVLNEDNNNDKQFRIWLLEVTKNIIEDGMNLLGIEMLEEM